MYSYDSTGPLQTRDWMSREYAFIHESRTWPLILEHRQWILQKLNLMCFADIRPLGRWRWNPETHSVRITINGLFSKAMGNIL